MEVIAANLANIHTTKTEEGGPYKKKEVVFMSTDVSDEKSFGDVLSKKIEGVKVDSVQESGKDFEKVFDPNHPDACVIAQRESHGGNDGHDRGHAGI